jgi:hypothetical protein
MKTHQTIITEYTPPPPRPEFEQSELANDIMNGLPAEIAARKKRHEYYRDRLLRFEESI